MQIIKRGRPKGRSTDKRSFGPLGDLMRAHRLQKNLGLQDVARAVKCSVQFISNIEHGRAPLPWDKTEQLAKYLEINAEELHAANLAIRSDFKSFIKTASHSGSTTRKVGKSQTALSGMKDTASLMTLTAQDLNLREVIQKYQSASIASKKKFVLEAKRLLVTE